MPICIKLLIKSLRIQVQFNRNHHKSGLEYTWAATSPKVKMMLGADLEDYLNKFKSTLRISNLTIYDGKVYDQSGLQISQTYLLKNYQNWLNNRYGKEEY